MLYRINDIPNKVCILRLYTNQISAEDESIDSKYTDLNCVKSQYAHFIRNIINSIFAETISRSRIMYALYGIYTVFRTHGVRRCSRYLL